jgi:hypothetical protein
MAKAEISQATVIAVTVVGGVLLFYIVYQTFGRSEPALTVAQKPATWVAEGAEYWSDWATGLPADIVQAVDPDPDRTILGYDEGSLLWGYGPKGKIQGKWYNPFD